MSDTWHVTSPLPKETIKAGGLWMGFGVKAEGTLLPDLRLAVFCCCTKHKMEKCPFLVKFIAFKWGCGPHLQWQVLPQQQASWSAWVNNWWLLNVCCRARSASCKSLLHARPVGSGACIGYILVALRLEKRKSTRTTAALWPCWCLEVQYVSVFTLLYWPAMVRCLRLKVKVKELTW